MKTLELLTETTTHTIERQKQDRAMVLTVGSRPVAVLLPMAEETAHLAEYEKVVEKGESVTLTVDGKPVAVLQPLVPLVLIEDEDADLESVTLSTSPKFLTLIEQARKRQESEGGISSNEMRRRLGLKAKKGQRRRQ